MTPTIEIIKPQIELLQTTDCAKQVAFGCSVKQMLVVSHPLIVAKRALE